MFPGYWGMVGLEVVEARDKAFRARKWGAGCGGPVEGRGMWGVVLVTQPQMGSWPHGTQPTMITTLSWVVGVREGRRRVNICHAVWRGQSSALWDRSDRE